MHPRTGIAEDVRVEARVVASILVQRAVFTAHGVDACRRSIDRAEHNDFQSLLALGLAGEGGDENMSVGMQLSVLCSEDAPRVTQTTWSRRRRGTLFGEHLLGNQLKACEFWPQGRRRRVVLRAGRVRRAGAGAVGRSRSRHAADVGRGGRAST